ALDDLVVAVGVEGSAEQHLASRATADGLAWTDGVVSDAGRVEVVGVAAGGGRVVAVGTERPASADTGAIPGVWVSTDGIEWDRRAPAPGEGTVPLAIVWHEGQFLLVTSSDGVDGEVWVSPDGAAWTRLETDGTSPQVSRGMTVWQGRIAGLGPYAVSVSPPLG
ncbi:MAG: hypothetical protein ABIJ75_08190, partial [Actinomycetota bacterium]